MSTWQEAFEPIGDNCELGFMQRQKGVDEGALLKWCRILKHTDLITFLDAPRESFYKFENLKPTSNDMVEDISSNIQFHTELYSRIEDGIRTFNAVPHEQERIYAAEYQKRLYLYDKLIDALSNASRICVFKMNGTNDLEVAQAIADRLKSFNIRNRLFYITDAEPAKAGFVERISHNVYRGFITAFAPYWPVTDAKLEYWDGLCKSAYERISNDFIRNA